MKKVSQTRQFLMDVKKVAKRGKNLNKLKRIVSFFANGKPLEASCRDHGLTGQWKPFRNCHIEPDCMRLYTIDEENLILERT